MYVYRIEDLQYTNYSRVLRERLLFWCQSIWQEFLSGTETYISRSVGDGIRD